MIPSWNYIEEILPTFSHNDTEIIISIPRCSLSAVFILILDTIKCKKNSILLTKVPLVNAEKTLLCHVFIRHSIQISNEQIISPSAFMLLWDNEEMYTQIYLAILKQLRCFSLEYVNHYRKMYKWGGELVASNSVGAKLHLLLGKHGLLSVERRVLILLRQKLMKGIYRNENFLVWSR